MTDEQRKLARHALGMGGSRPGHRNYFCATPGTPADAAWAEMVRREMALLCRVPSEGLPYNTYAVAPGTATALLVGDL